MPTPPSFLSSYLNGGKWLEPLRNRNPQNFITLPFNIAIAYALVKLRNNSNVLHDFCSSDTRQTSWLMGMFVEIRSCCILPFLVMQQGKVYADLGHLQQTSGQIPCWQQVQGEYCRPNRVPTGAIYTVSHFILQLLWIFYLQSWAGLQ